MKLRLQEDSAVSQGGPAGHELSLAVIRCHSHDLLSVQACRRSFSGSISRSKFSEVSCTDTTLDTSLELVRSIIVAIVSVHSLTELAEAAVRERQ